MKKSFLLLFACLFFIDVVSQNTSISDEQHSILGQKVASQKRVCNSHPDAQWFPEAGLGLFVHMGLASVHGGIDLSWGMLANKKWDDGELPPAEYWKLADVWNPKKFKPQKWVKAAAKAGFKYIVFVTKHHDGYTMWPSKYGELGVKSKLKGRDLVKEFVEACRDNNVKVGLYFSPPDWYFDRNYRNWDASKKHFYDVNFNILDKRPVKPANHDALRREMVANQVRELLTSYGKIDLIFFDGGKGEISNSEVRILQPGIIINRRNGQPGDYGDSEGKLPSSRFNGWFETNDPCWPSRWWSYSTCDRMDTGEQVIENLIKLRAWGGNYLANVGPKSDGSIPEEALKAWKVMGRWMKHSGESVYDIQAGPYPENATQPVTLKGDSIMYVHFMPNYQKYALVNNVNRRPISAILLRTKDKVNFSYSDGVVKVSIPSHLRTRMVDTVKIYFE